MDSIKYNDFIKTSYKRYAIEVLENRALPDYRDGLKPVQRKALWTAYKLGLRNNKAFTKSSNVTGNLMARFHPHSDSYLVLVNLSQSSLSCNLFEGQGNWGNYIDPPAAARYTEVKLSKYSDKFLLDQRYLDVTKMLPNYLDSETEPMLLPSLLPTLLITGCQGIAVGYKTEIPTYTLKSVIKLVRLALTKTLNYKDLLCLEFDDVYNSKCIASKRQLLDLYKTGKASIPFGVDYVLDKTKSFTIKSIVGNGETLVRKLESDDRVYQVNNLTSGNDISLQVMLKSSISKDSVDEVAKDICARCVINRIFVTNVIERVVKEHKDGSKTFYDESAKLRETNLTDIINDWIKWRINLECDMLKNQIKLQEEKIEKLEFYRWVITKLDVIFRVLKNRAKDLQGRLEKALKCDSDTASMILAMPVRNLSKFNDDQLKNEIKECKQLIKEFKGYLKKPEKKIADDLSLINVKDFIA